MPTALIVLPDRTVMTDGTVALAYRALVEAVRDGARAADLLAAPDPRVAKYNSVAPAKVRVAVDDGVPDSPEPSTLELPTPEPFRSMDVLASCLALCRSPAHAARVEEEVAAMEARGMVPLVRFVAWLASDWRERGVTWGVGRGSSCASLVLHLLGAHRVDPVEHGIPLDEFLR